MKLLLTSKCFVGNSLAYDKALVVDEGKIIKIGGMGLKKEYPEAEVIDLRGLTTLPGLIDIHVHGGDGFDTMDGSYEAVNGISLFKLKEGVTSFIPTTVTASGDMTQSAVSGLREAVLKGVGGAKIIGLFLEGPYINPKNKGAHPQEFIKEVNLDEMVAFAKNSMEAIGADGKKRVLSFAIAPELDGAIEAISELVKMGVNVRIGHSSATIETVTESVYAGASIAIHTYNAMSPLNHRDPGMVGGVFTNKKMFAEIIADLIHVHPMALNIVLGQKGADKTILITDCMRAGGLPDGDYKLGELPVMVRNGEARLEGGVLAGSTATLIGCVKNMHEAVGAPFAEAIKMATATPAKALGLYNEIGSIDEGKCADIIAIDEGYNIKFAMVEGTTQGTVM